MAKGKSDELAEFIISRAFDPVMQAKPDGRSDSDKNKLEDMQRATGREIERYRNYGSREEVVTNFKRDLHSEPAKKVHAQLRRLDLPTIEDIRDEVMQRAGRQ